MSDICYNEWVVKCDGNNYFVVVVNSNFSVVVVIFKGFNGCVYCWFNFILLKRVV